MKTFWLSFCDTEKPRGQQFLGVAIVEVSDDDVATILPRLEAEFPNRRVDSEWIAAASRKAWEMGCNPGGEMASLEIPDEELKHLVETPRHVLLRREQLETLGHVRRSSLRGRRGSDAERESRPVSL